MTITLQPTDAPDTESIVRRIIAELDANPGAREPLLRALLTEEFLLMPARLTVVEENVASLLEMPARLTVVEENVASLLEMPARLTVVEENVASLLEMPARLTVVEENVASLLDVPARLTVVEENVASLLEVPARLTVVEENVASLLEVPARLTVVEENVASLRGGKLETDFAHSATSILNRMFGFRRCQVVHGKAGHIHIADQLVDQILDACDTGLITERQLRRIYDTDVIARCLRPSDSATVWVAVEVAARLDSADIDRAAQSAAALRQVFGQDVLAVAAGERIDPPDRARAAQAGVTLFQMGEDADEDAE